MIERNRRVTPCFSLDTTLAELVSLMPPSARYAYNTADICEWSIQCLIFWASWQDCHVGGCHIDWTEHVITAADANMESMNYHCYV